MPPIANQGNGVLPAARPRPPRTAPGQGRRRPGRVWWAWPRPVPRRSSPGRRRSRGLPEGPSTCSGVWRGQADGGVAVEQGAGGGQRQVLLADVEDRGAGQHCDVGPVVDCPEPAVPDGGFLQHGQELQLLGRLDALVAELDDVHPAGKRRVHELGKVAAVPAGIGAQVQPCCVERGRCRESVARWTRAAAAGVECTFMAASLVPLNWAGTAGARGSCHKAPG